jgi:prepilin-type N-terminal cleavage/methylation domain-containing protein
MMRNEPAHPTRNGERGMSLLEVLIALLILAFVALGIASLFHHAQLMNASGYSYAVLASEARRTVEAIQSTAFNSAALSQTDAGPRLWPDAARGFTIRYTVVDFDLGDWRDVFDFANDVPVAPAAWPTPDPADPNTIRLKRVTVRVSANTRFLTGRRDFVVTTLRIPD